MKKITAIIVSAIIALSAFAIGYKMGAVDTMGPLSYNRGPVQGVEATGE